MPHPELPPLPEPRRYLLGGNAKMDEACTVSYAVLVTSPDGGNGDEERAAIFTQAECLAWGQEVRRMALEEAAALCAKMASERVKSLGATGAYLTGSSVVNERMKLAEGMVDCATAIRALIEKQRTE